MLLYNCVKTTTNRVSELTLVSIQTRITTHLYEVLKSFLRGNGQEVNFFTRQGLCIRNMDTYQNTKVFFWTSIDGWMYCVPTWIIPMSRGPTTLLSHTIPTWRVDWKHSRASNHFLMLITGSMPILFIEGQNCLPIVKESSNVLMGFVLFKKQ